MKDLEAPYGDRDREANAFNRFTQLKQGSNMIWSSSRNTVGELVAYIDMPEHALVYFSLLGAPRDTSSDAI